MGWCSSRTGQSGSEVWRGLAPMEPEGPCWPLPSLSSWQMKETKQSSPALSNAPGTPCPDPPTASLRGQKGGQLRLKDQGSQPCFSFPGPSGAVDPRRAACRVARPGRRGVWPREGVSGHSGQGHPALGTPSPTPSPAVPGPRQRKTKTRAEETAAGAPPEKPGQKARASRPRCPAAGGLAPLPGSVPLALAARCASQPPDYLPPSRPLPRAAPAPTPFPTTSGCFCGRAPRCPRGVPQAVPTERGRRDPSPAATFPAAPGSAPFPGSAPSPWGAGAPGEAGSRPGRRRLHSSGGRGGSVARALLGAQAGTREGRDRRGGVERGGWGVSSLHPLRSRRGAPSASCWVTDAYLRAEVGAVADRASRRETVSGRQFGLAQPRKDDPGRPSKEDTGTEHRTS